MTPRSLHIPSGIVLLGLVAELENELGPGRARDCSAHGHWPTATRPSEDISAGRDVLGRPRSFRPAEDT